MGIYGVRRDIEDPEILPRIVEQEPTYGAWLALSAFKHLLKIGIFRTERTLAATHLRLSGCSFEPFG